MAVFLVRSDGAHFPPWVLSPESSFPPAQAQGLRPQKQASMVPPSLSLRFPGYLATLSSLFTETFDLPVLPKGQVVVHIGEGVRAKEKRK